MPEFLRFLHSVGASRLRSIHRPQKLLMAQGKVHQAYGSAWGEIFTMALLVFIINPAAKGCVITASANFCKKRGQSQACLSYAEPSKNQ